jgi:hypothetical protein
MIRNLCMANCECPKRSGIRRGHGPCESSGVSVAAALLWPVSHGEGRVTPSSRSTFNPAVYKFATHRVPGVIVGSGIRP